MASNVHKSLVSSIRNWRIYAEHLGLLRKSPADLDVIPSASNMDETTYMALRVLRPERQKATRFPEFTKEIADRAREHLELDHQFHVYLKHIENGEKDVYGQDELARFQIVRDNQLQITEIPAGTVGTSEADDIPPAPRAQIGMDMPGRRRSARTRNLPQYYQSPSFGSTISYSVASDHTAASVQEGVDFPKAKDEQFVNESIISLLKAFTLNIARVTCKWSSHRNPFSSVELGPKGSGKKLTALTDGYLESRTAPTTIFALVEAKAAIRERTHHQQVLWQEAAEIVAWIMTDPLGSHPQCLEDMIPDKGKRSSCRILISQDRQEIFITIASYPAMYTLYLGGTKGDHGDFLTLHEYGPWNIWSCGDMRHFAFVVVQLCMAISDDEKRDYDIPMIDA